MDEPIDKDIRGATNLRIKFRSANLDEFIDRYAVDISRGGIFIRTREPLSVNSRLKLDFQLLDAQPLLEGEGTVVWIRQPDPGRPEVTPGMGVRFDKLTPDSQARLDKILSEKDRLAQAGKAPGMSKSGGVAVRRPTGTFATVDSAGGARRPTGAAAPLESVGAGAKPAGPPPAPAPASKPPAIPDAKSAAAPPRLTGAGMSTGSGSPLRAAPATTGFGRPRTTTGGMNARSAPVPSSLFEPPTADDIDRALAVLEDKPGPIPAMAPPPRIVPAVPIAVADDASNEPTRVVSDPQEFAAHEAVTGRGVSVLPETGVPEAPVPIGEDLTAPASLDEDGTMATMAASPAAFAAAERALGGAASATTERKSASALDAVVPVPDAPAGPSKHPAAPPPAPLPGPLRKKSAIVEAATSPAESGRFRTNATYRRPRTALKRTVAIAVVVVAGGGAAFKLWPRVRAMLASSEVATKPAPAPTPAPQPTPSAAVDAGATAGSAADAALAAVAPGGTPAGTMGPAPAPEAAKGTTAAGGTPEPTTAAPAEAKPAPAAEEARPRRKRPRQATAESGDAKPEAKAEAAKPEGAGPEAAKAEAAKPEGTKTEESKTEGTKTAEKPAGDTGEAKPAAEGAAAAAAAPAAAAGPATLKITSIPGGAEVIIDGTSMGTTPFSSKDVDPTTQHAITIKKDGFEAQERAIGAANWQHPRSGPLLKVSVKLKRTAVETPKAEPKEAKPEVEIITPD